MAQPSKKTISGDPDTYLESYNDRILAYLRDEDDYAIYQPLDRFENHASWPEEDLARIRALQIPTLANRSASDPSPDVLLYRLGRLETLDSEFDQRLLKLLECPGHSAIVNASGTGKTRLLFEALHHRWGFYLTCAQDLRTNPYGSSDLCYLTLSPQPGMRPHLLLPSRRTHDNSHEVDSNREITRRCIKHVLLARMMVFTRFCQLFRDAGVSQDVARRKWLLLQLRPQTVVRADIFRHLFDQLGRVTEDAATAEISRLRGLCFVQPEFVIIDEAQIASRGFRDYFTTEDRKSYAPLLRELVICLSSALPDSRLLVAGTSVDMSVVREAIQHSATNVRDVSFFHSLGSFKSLERTTNYLRHFLGDISDAQCKEVFNRMRGRHRFLAVFVQHVLQAGIAQLTRVLDSLVHALTGFTPKRVALYQSPWMLYGSLITDKDLDNLKNGLAGQLRKSLLRFAFGKQSTVLRSNVIDAVQLALGLFISDDEVEIFEPLVFYRLVSWLRVTKVYSVDALLRRRLGDPTVPMRKSGVAEGLPLYFASAFSGDGGVLDDFFRFEGPSPPFWKDYKAQLIVRTGARRNPFRVAPTSAAVISATTSQDVLSWLSNNAQHPFLVTNWAQGPDLLFFLDVRSIGLVLVCLDCDPFPDSRARRWDRVVPSDPSWFYPNSPKDRKDIISVIKDIPPVPLDKAHRRGKKIVPGRMCKFSTLHILCFARAWKADQRYDPPVACLNLDALLKRDVPAEIDYPDVVDAASKTEVLDPVVVET
ncbi:hypothetical protein EXIGLDRAFT_830997 [Exidia glandulosa HHB12029]|uniref:Uncharacterized protein n=1 Tax=Exidia glandulosa HHB12029 TaxID=1314781 RepID=A0A165N3D3_EXIGL|nr:hypothetical protein EXIGLDRAFT_830997 [Exidia glandulosa HHB12029]